jgi:tetratricopeptide (TPR) repeat protein
MQIYKLTEAIKNKVDPSKISLNKNDPLIVDSDAYFQKSIKSAFSLKSPLIPSLLKDYAVFLLECRDYEASEDYFLKSLSLNPFSKSCLNDYSKLLKVIGDIEYSKKFWDIMFLISNSKLKTN